MFLIQSSIFFKFFYAIEYGSLNPLQLSLSSSWYIGKLSPFTFLSYYRVMILNYLISPKGFSVDYLGFFVWTITQTKNNEIFINFLVFMLFIIFLFHLTGWVRQYSVEWVTKKAVALVFLQILNECFCYFDTGILVSPLYQDNEISLPFQFSGSLFFIS